MATIEPYFMKAIIEQMELENKIEINRANLLKIKEICENASRGPWNYDENEYCQRIFSNPIQTYPDENGEEVKFLGHGLQLAKCIKKNSTMAEYWFTQEDMNFIISASKWMLPIVNELLKHYPE